MIESALDTDNMATSWAVTESTGYYGQLECGARALDIRPYQDGEDLICYHGPILFHDLIAETLVEVDDWCAENPGELVILYFNHFKDEVAIENTRSLIDSKGYHEVENTE